MHKRNWLAMAAMFMAVWSLAAADIWVAAGAAGRGKARDDPMPELWKAVERAERGDVIHVAEGTYNGKAGSGHWIAKVPNLTMVGGYRQDFSERNPFKYFTILERAKDFRGDWTGLPEAIVSGDADHSNFTIDGFVLNCESRNVYTEKGLKLQAPTYSGMALQTNSPNTKVRNCILLNPAGDGIYCTWQGSDNEVSNCFIVNTLYAAIETRSAQPDSVINIKNNTIVYGWFYPTKGGATGVFVGRQGTTIVDSNVIAFLQTEGGEDGFGVKNTFANFDTVMKNNVFFSLTGGYYKYMDNNKQSLIAWKPSDLEDLNDEEYCEDYTLAESGGNREADPGLVPDKDFAGKFSNYIASEPGKLNMDAMNEWRRSMGLPLQAEPGKARENYAFAYPLKAVVPGLGSKIKGVGVRIEGPFAAYASEAAGAKTASYEEAAFDSFKKGGANSKGTNGKAVSFRAGLGDKKTTFEIAEATSTNYYSVMLLIPGSTSTATRDFVYGYILKGSPADKDWIKLEAKKSGTWKDGVVIKGKVYDFKNQTYPYPVGVIIDSISSK
ncbi:MAG: right-handed parallel beta-helix repeat-containing protein [Spirochaetes bacterium]|nr:right-handed parallel beta-helix repeat-containing protein [Spirochaetota bacterium]